MKTSPTGTVNIVLPEGMTAYELTEVLLAVMREGERIRADRDHRLRQERRANRKEPAR